MFSANVESKTYRLSGFTIGSRRRNRDAETPARGPLPSKMLLLLRRRAPRRGRARRRRRRPTATLEVVADGRRAAARCPGATVEVKRPDTGLSRTGVTDATGGSRRSRPSRPGTYDVAVKLPGFETVEQKGVVLLVGQSAPRERDPARDSRPRASASSRRRRSSTSTRPTPRRTSSPEQIQDLPTPDRDFQKLAFIAPGVERERGAFRFVTGGPGHRRRRQREPVDDPRGRRRLHRPGARPREDAVLAGRDLRVPRHQRTASTPRSAAPRAARSRS